MEAAAEGEDRPNNSKNHFKENKRDEVGSGSKKTMWKRQQQERGGQTTAKTTSRQGKQARWRENEKFGYWAIRLPRAMQKILPRSCLPSHWSCLGAPRARSSSLWSSRCHGTPHLHSNVAPTFCAHPTRPRQLPSATKRHAHGGVDRIFAAFRAGDTTPHAKQTSSVAGSVVPQHSCSSGRRLGATRQGRVVLVFLEVEVQLAVDVLVM